MKASLIRTAPAWLRESPARAELLDRSNTIARDGLTMLPWVEGLPLWRAALGRLSGATFYHCEPWIEALRTAYPLDLRVATLHRGGELRAAAVFARSKTLLKTKLVSLPFSDSGELLANDDDAREELLCALTASRAADAIEVRGTSGPVPWVNVDCFAHWTLDLTRPYKDISAGFSRNVRNGVKRGLKDRVTIDRGSSDAYLSRYFELQLQTRRRLGIPPQPYKFFAKVHEQFALRGQSEVWFATLEGRDQAGLVMLRHGDQLCYKWGARVEGCHPGANHLLVASAIEEHAEKAAAMDFGRCDTRNQGLIRSKTELGCVARALPYAFYPVAPRRISSEVLEGPAKILSTAWKKLPLPVTRVLGEALYRYMA